MGTYPDAQPTTTPFVDLDWKSDQNVRSFVESKFLERDQFNFDRMRQSEINIAWYRGHQETRWHARERRLFRYPNPNKRVRLIINLMQPLIEGYISKLASDPINWVVEPATGDSGDFDIARLSTQILESYFYRMDVERIVEQCDRWATLTGQAFLKVCWDPFAGEEAASIGPEDVGLDAAAFRREFKSDAYSLKLGDLSIEPISLFNISWGPSECKFQDAEYVLVSYERSAAYCMERYGLDREQVKSAYDNSMRLYRPGDATAFGTVQTQPREDTCLVKEMWVRKNASILGLEQGRHVVVVGNETVKNAPNPYRHGRIPIVEYSLLEPPGQVRGETFVDNLIAPQATINVRVSQICEIAELNANPVWLAQLGSITNEDEWIDRRGGVRYFKGITPTLVPGSAAPPALLNEVQYQIRFMQDIAGIHDVSQAKNPAGTRSGRAIALLKEADDERLGPVAKRRRDFWSDAGYLALQTLAQFVTEERLVKVLGDENAWETAQFTGKSLIGQNRGANISYFDVRIKSNGVPRSRSSREEAAMFLVERGFFKPDNPDDRETVMQIMEFGSTREPIDSTQDSRRRQQRYNQTMAMGQYVPPREEEDHEIQLEELQKFRRKDRFLSYPQDIQMLFARHEVERLMLMAQRTLKLQAIAQAGVSQIQQAQGQLPPPQQNSANSVDTNTQVPLSENANEQIPTS